MIQYHITVMCVKNCLKSPLLPIFRNIQGPAVPPIPGTDPGSRRPCVQIITSDLRFLKCQFASQPEPGYQQSFVQINVKIENKELGKDIYVYLIIFTKKSKTTCPMNCVIESNANSPSVLVGSVLICICQRAQLLEVLYRCIMFH